MLIEYTPKEFLTLRKTNPEYKDIYTMGVYILYNQTKKKYYVGQSSNLFDRVFLHFNGRGNGDVYFDYKSGDIFSIRLYKFDPNQFRDLNEFEYHFIRIYESNDTGYNRQAGNRTRQVSK